MDNENSSSISFSRRFTSRVLNLKIVKQPHAWHPPTDLFETEEAYTVRVEIAGIREEDFSVSFMDEIITVVGRRSPLNDKCAYHRLEIPYGEFTTSVQLPEDADLPEAEAEYENGFLTITIPKIKKINILINPNER